MTDAGIIAIVSGYAAFAGLVVFLVVKLLGYHATLQAMDDERDKANAERDEETRKRVAAEKQLADATQRLEAAEKRRNEAFEAAREHIRKEIRSAPDAVAALNAVLAAAPGVQRPVKAEAKPADPDADRGAADSLLIADLK